MYRDIGKIKEAIDLIKKRIRIHRGWIGIYERKIAPTFTITT
jgi:hypothetical protein